MNPPTSASAPVPLTGRQFAMGMFVVVGVRVYGLAPNVPFVLNTLQAYWAVANRLMNQRDQPHSALPLGDGYVYMSSEEFEAKRSSDA